MRNACSERKPRSLTAVRTLSLSWAEGYRKFREITVFDMKNHLSWWYRSGATRTRNRPSRNNFKTKKLVQQHTTKWPQPFMFQYPQPRSSLPTVPPYWRVFNGLALLIESTLVSSCPKLSKLVLNLSM